MLQFLQINQCCRTLLCLIKNALNLQLVRFTNRIDNIDIDWYALVGLVISDSYSQDIVMLYYEFRIQQYNTMQVSAGVPICPYFLCLVCL